MTINKPISKGRGGNYSFLRYIVEKALRTIYAFEWPARVWGRLPGTCRVRITSQVVTIGEKALLRIPLKICFVSDLHIGPSTPRRLLENAFVEIEKANPDVLILGGDYVFLDATSDRMRFLQSLVSSVSCPVKVGVFGNHDLWADNKAIEASLQKAGVRILENESFRLPPPNDQVTIIGLDEPRTGLFDLQKALLHVNKKNILIGVCHSPNGVFESAGTMDLFLAGHTHGGQIALPGGYPILLPHGRGCRNWPHGRHISGGTEIIVSRGLGGTELPIRIFAPPEICIITLRTNTGE